MAKRKRGPRIVHFEAKTAEGYRWLRQHARGAKPIYVDDVSANGRGAFLVTDEAAWAESLRVADAKEI